MIPKHRVKRRRAVVRRNKLISRMLNIYFEGTLTQLLMLSATIISCIWYISGTYSIINQSTALDLTFFSVFLLDYVMCITAAHRKFDYCLSTTGLADFVSLVPIIGILYPADPNDIILWQSGWLGFLRFFRILNIFQLIQLRNSFGNATQSHDSLIQLNLSEVSYRIGRLCVSILVFILVSTGIIFAVTIFDQGSFDTPYLEVIMWFDCCYFTVVTVTTVGYGDITPKTVAAKLVTIFVILFGFALIPSQVAALVTALYQRPKYLGTLVLPINTQHICVCGIVDYELLLRLLTEIFHPTHAAAIIGAKIMVVVLSPIGPSRLVEVLLRLYPYRSRVRFFVGSSKSPLDLSRIKAEDALAIYLVSDLVAASLRAEEDAVFLSGISISRYLDFKMTIKNFQADLRFSSKLKMATKWDQWIGAIHGGSTKLINSRPIRPRTMMKLTSSARNRAVLAGAGVDIILSLQEFKYTLIAYGAIFPGFLSLFLNLNRSRTSSQQSTPNWRQPDLYYEGSRFCIHQMSTNNDSECRPSLRKMSFHDAVLSLYSKSSGNVFLVAVKRFSEVLINPIMKNSEKGGEPSCVVPWCLGDCEAVFVIAPSWETAWEVMTEEDEVEIVQESISLPIVDEYVLQSEIDPSQKDIRGVASSSVYAQNFTPSQDSVNINSGLSLDSPEISNVNRRRSVDAKDEKESNDGDGHVIKLLRLNSCVTSIMRVSEISHPENLLINSKKLNNSLSPVSLAYDKILSPRNRCIREGETEPQYLSRQLPRSLVSLKDHVVLIISSIGRPETLTASALMLPIVFFIKGIRAQSAATIVVLCERAEELSKIVEEFDEANPHLLEDVFFFAGVARNPEHLKICGVERARAVATIRSPIAAESSEDSSFVSKSAIVNADKHTIITSLNLHMILQKQHQSNVRGQVKNADLYDKKFNSTRTAYFDRRDTSVKVPFTVCELVHESNIVFLREQCQELMADPSEGEDIEGLNSSACINNSNDITTDFYDWPLLAAGCIFSHTLLDALMVQAMFNPDIISFWEALTSTGQRGKCNFSKVNQESQSNYSQSQPSRLSTFASLGPMKSETDLSNAVYRGRNQKKQDCRKQDKDIFAESKEEIDVGKSIDAFQDFNIEKPRDTAYSEATLEEGGDGLAAQKLFSTLPDIGKAYEKSESYRGRSRSANEFRSEGIKKCGRNISDSSGNNHDNIGKSIPSQSDLSLLDKILVPQCFVGKPFGCLFHAFLVNDRVIAIALYRTQISTDNSSQAENRDCPLRNSFLRANNISLPFVITAPAPETILHFNDEVFLFRGAS